MGDMIMPTLRTFLAVLTLMLSFAVAACGTTPTAGAREAVTVGETQRISAYTLGSSDRLRITVFGHQDLSGEFEIDGTGAISMPLIGQVSAEDLTTVQLEALIASKLSEGYVLDPRVSAEVINYRPFYILGEVARPGEYPYTNGLSVQNAIAAAGGFTYRANRRVIYIKSMDSNSEIAYDLTPGTVVRPGDTLRVGERIF